jgi:hypothetical protein
LEDECIHMILLSVFPLGDPWWPQA